MSDMIETIALAIMNSDRVAAGLPALESRDGVVDSDGYVRNARAAVAAMREPTSAMIDRFVSRALCVSVHGVGGWSEYARGQWLTMIDAAGEG